MSFFKYSKNQLHLNNTKKVKKLIEHNRPLSFAQFRPKINRQTLTNMDKVEQFLAIQKVLPDHGIDFHH